MASRSRCVCVCLPESMPSLFNQSGKARHKKSSQGSQFQVQRSERPTSSSLLHSGDVGESLLSATVPVTSQSYGGATKQVCLVCSAQVHSTNVLCAKRWWRNMRNTSSWSLQFTVLENCFCFQRYNLSDFFIGSYHRGPKLCPWYVV